MVVAGMEHLPHDPDGCYLDELPEDEYQDLLARADASYASLLDRATKPHESLLRLGASQVWVWMNGPVEPHWAIRGTGVVLDE